MSFTPQDEAMRSAITATRGALALRGATACARGEEHCPMCAAALLWARIRHVVYAAPHRPGTRQDYRSRGL